MTNKYVNPTGDGYISVAVVSHRSLHFGLNGWPVDWSIGTEVYAVIESDGVALLSSERAPPEYVTTYTVSDRSGISGASIGVGGPVLDILGVEAGDDVRAYERDAGDVVLVRAADDPFVEADDG